MKFNIKINKFTTKRKLESEVERLRMYYPGGNKVILDEVMREYLNNELGSSNPFVSDEEAIVCDEKEIEKFNEFIISWGWKKSKRKNRTKQEPHKK